MRIHKDVWSSISHGRSAADVISSLFSTELVLDAYICLAALALGILHVPAGYWWRWLALRILAGLVGLVTSPTRQAQPTSQTQPDPETSTWRRAHAARQ